MLQEQMADSGRCRCYQSLLSLGGFSGCRLKAQSCKICGELGLTSPPFNGVNPSQLVSMGVGSGLCEDDGCPEGAEGAQDLLRFCSKCGKKLGHLP